MKKFKNLKLFQLKYSKVLENYFFMTLLQIVGLFIGLLIYPYLIRTLGAESYGLYVFSLSVTAYFSSFVSFGFSFPAVRKISENKDDIKIKNEVISSVFTAKFYLAIFSTLIYLILLYFVPTIHKNWRVFTICYSQIIGELLLPIWYFQGVQKMQLVTYVQLSFRILTIPFIFLFVLNPSDCWIYSLITSSSIIFGGISSVIILKRVENITLNIVPFSQLKNYFLDAIPFFWTSSAGLLKQESITVIIGAFFGMKEVALYDLANKIIIIPRILTTNINAALFPKIVENIQQGVVKKIIRIETWIGLAIIAGVSLFGYWIILLLGGSLMLGAYPLAIILSVTVLVWLVVGCYINFIFVPRGLYYFVTKNQIIALTSFIFICFFGILIFHNILIVIISLSISGLCEIIYCNYLIKKYKLL